MNILYEKNQYKEVSNINLYRSETSRISGLNHFHYSLNKLLYIIVFGN